MRRAVRRAAASILGSLGVFPRLHRRRLGDVVTILNYHGLVRSRLPVDDWCFLPLERFEAQMRYLASSFQVMHLEEALDPGRPRSRRPVACVTFDDGFASLDDLALPVLEALSIPATVFLVTDLVDTDRTTWACRLHQAVSETVLPEVRFRGARLPLRGAAARAAASAWLQGEMKRLPPQVFEERMDALLAQLGAGRAQSAPLWEPFRILGTGGIRRMARGDVVRFGAHTASHQILARASPALARHEIERSVSAVSGLLESPSRVFAYPNGRAEDFDDHAVTVLRESGVTHAVTTIEGPNDASTDPYRLRRYGIGSDDPMGRFLALVHHAPTILGKWARVARGAQAPFAPRGGSPPAARGRRSDG